MEFEAMKLAFHARKGRMSHNVSLFPDFFKWQL
jgi:hypothetical protein